jgi:tRNA(Arg) A34 adenosine deaminase TadA
MSNKSLDSQWMELALKQALLAEQKGEVPVGSLISLSTKPLCQPKMRKQWTMVFF